MIYTLQQTVDINVALIDTDGQPIAGFSSDQLKAAIFNDAGQGLDGDSEWTSASEEVQWWPMTERVDALTGLGVYSKSLPAATLGRGRFIAVAKRFDTDQTFLVDFEVGTSVDRKMGHSIVYDGTSLDLTVWLEEMGILATDIEEAYQAAIKGPAGSLMASPTLTGSGGVFRGQVTVALEANTRYTLEVTFRALLSGGGLLDIPLIVGLVRP